MSWKPIADECWDWVGDGGSASVRKPPVTTAKGFPYFAAVQLSANSEELGVIGFFATADCAKAAAEHTPHRVK